MRKVWAAAAVVFALSVGEAAADKLSHANILGAWCGDESRYVFTRDALTVTWMGKSDRRVLHIASWEFSDTWINVKWKPKGNTVFSEFKGNTMAQRPNTTGDMGPRREFHRCK